LLLPEFSTSDYQTQLAIMSPTKFQQRIACLNEADRERILCAFLTSDSNPPLVVSPSRTAAQNKVLD